MGTGPLIAYGPISKKTTLMVSILLPYLLIYYDNVAYLLGFQGFLLYKYIYPKFATKTFSSSLILSSHKILGKREYLIWGCLNLSFRVRSS